MNRKKTRFNKAQLKEIEQRDKRMAAIHEAGHLTVAYALGCRARAWIFPTDTNDPTVDYLWIGKCESMCADSAPERGIAGVVAEWWADDDSGDPEDIWSYISCDPKCMSPSDRMLIPEGSELELIQTALRLLRENRRYFEWAVNRLLEEESITDGEAADMWHEMTGVRVYHPFVQEWIKENGIGHGASTKENIVGQDNSTR